ncbi:hypothetical protein M422DRAFT_36420 [Sphaerobolus stellatus SS14]|uniref:Nephrocystin 3-like N-terminal domain-containing protein n=1 Tax=Sphaerobolus stellatus (strain SS14) TaxID=990650 RepID=A0A0C9V048_SPHS4|nr:hypothetical protein M422DRAFT_36420 [Sphaerobolus stellatus SS14]
MPPRRAHSANPPLSTTPGNHFENIHVNGGQVHIGNAYYEPYRAATTGRGEIDAQEDARYVLNKLEPYINRNASYNSYEREQEGASICQSGTRERILAKIEEWITGEDPSVLWLYGPAGAGKSTIAQTIAERCYHRKNLAFSYFFSRRNANRNECTRAFQHPQSQVQAARGHTGGYRMLVIASLDCVWPILIATWDLKCITLTRLLQPVH